MCKNTIKKGISERASAWANQGKLHFSLLIREAAQFQGQAGSTVCLCSFSAKKLESLCLSVNVYSNYLHLSSDHSNRRLVHGHFVNGIPFALSMRHRFTVAGNNGRFFFFGPLCFFQQQYCYIKCA